VRENSAITQRAFLTTARLKISRLRLDDGLESAFQRVVDISAQALEVSRVGIWLFDLPRRLLVCQALHDPRPGLTRPSLAMESFPLYCDAVRGRRFVATADVRSDPATAELRGYFDVHGITSLLDAAIYRGGEVVGVVCHEHIGPPREWKREEHQFAATVADLVATLLEADERLSAELLAHQLELELKDAHRLDALGRLSGGVAHDLNNLLGTIGNGLGVLKKHLDGDADALRVMELLEEQGAHAAALVKQLVTLGRGQELTPQREPLDPLLDSIQRVLAGEFQPPWQLTVDRTPGLTVWADAAQFRQVFINLLLNAREAMPAGGVALLRVREAPDAVVLEVIDTGEGIPEQQLHAVFDPYFTTRERGSGVGLSIVEQIVHQHGGALSVSSTVGDGTTMGVRWPSSAPASR
jgi:signal transduction histidine kinase